LLCHDEKLYQQKIGNGTKKGQRKGKSQQKKARIKGNFRATEDHQTSGFKGDKPLWPRQLANPILKKMWAVCIDPWHEFDFRDPQWEK
jgi:hypothetical protein